MAGLEPLKITGYTDKTFKTPLSGDPYMLMINPESIKWERKVDYNSQQPLDSSSPSQNYKSTPSASLSFDIVIDCTGVVDPKRIKMSKEIGQLERIVYTYNGEIHRPNYVKIQWGNDIVFNSVLKSFNTTYTLFRPDGSPLRAKISLSFGEYIAPCTVKKLDKQESPDVSHLVEVIEGNTLPGLCYRVWKDPFYYIQAAQYNELNKFRNLKPAENLIFPPILQSN